MWKIERTNCRSSSRKGFLSSINGGLEDISIRLLDRLSSLCIPSEKAVVKDKSILHCGLKHKLFCFRYDGHAQSRNV